MDTSNQITRREAVKTAGKIAAVAAASAVAGHAAARVRAAGTQVAYGVIGTGDRGTFLANRLKSVENGRCIAMCDIYEPNLNAVLKLYNNQPRGYRDYREMLADRNIDAVLIATPLFRHFDITRDALTAGKHVFCEKSLVFKAEEVHALRRLASERPSQVLQTGLQRRYSPFYQAAKAMIDKGMLGTVTHVRAQWHRNTAGRRAVKDPSLERQINWRFYREYSGGLAAELASHQIDVADWMFGSTAEFVTGVGGIDHWKDGRTTFDNIQLIFKYPKGQKLLYSAISTNAHLSLFKDERPQFGEEIMGTGGSLQISIFDSMNPVVGPTTAIWFREPAAATLKPAGEIKGENWVAGATSAASGKTSRGLPLLLSNDMVSKSDSFLQREMKFARQWLYSKGVMMPVEERNPVELSLEDFFRCIMEGKRPKAGLEVGLNDSIAVILSNLAMDEGRRVYFNEIDRMGA